MSRADRERQQLAKDRWPALSEILAGPIGERLAGDQEGLAKALDNFAATLALSEQIAAARECRDFGDYFAKRYDEGRFIADGFGLPAFRRLKEREGDARIKALYASLASYIRKTDEDWKP